MEERRIEKATVKGLILHYEKGGMEGVKLFLNEYDVFKDTWLHKIKTLTEDGHIKSAEEEIKLVGFNIDLRNKLYNPNIFKDGHRKNS